MFKKFIALGKAVYLNHKLNSYANSIDTHNIIVTIISNNFYDNSYLSQAADEWVKLVKELNDKREHFLSVLLSEFSGDTKKTIEASIHASVSKQKGAVDLFDESAQLLKDFVIPIRNEIDDDLSLSYDRVNAFLESDQFYKVKNALAFENLVYPYVKLNFVFYANSKELDADELATFQQVSVYADNKIKNQNETVSPSLAYVNIIESILLKDDYNLNKLIQHFSSFDHVNSDYHPDTDLEIMAFSNYVEPEINNRISQLVQEQLNQKNTSRTANKIKI